MRWIDSASCPAHYRRVPESLRVVVFVAILGLTSCSTESALVGLPPLLRVPLTIEQRVIPAHPVGPELGNPALPENLPLYLERGYGELNVIPGDQSYVPLTVDRTVPPELGPMARQLLRFAAVGDFQIGDDESPTRVGLLDGKGLTSAALRPQDPYLCVLANATVRTLNALHRMQAIGLTFVGGDVLDSAQQNEMDWALGILTGGAPVECDSGADDDLVPGPGNDPKDPFLPEGLLMPWRWVPGNHDLLVQGNLLTDADRVEMATGDFASLGTRDYGQGGRVISGRVVADLRRRPLTPTEMMHKVAAHGDGHGLSLSQSETGHASYSLDIEGTSIRFLVVDTVSKTGGSGGVLRWQDVNAYLRPQFESAQRDGKWLFVLSDHPHDDLGQANTPLGRPVSDPVSQNDWVELLGSYPNVLFSFARRTSHGQSVMKPVGSRPYWAVFNAAQSEFPHQIRLFEVWDADNGYVLLRISSVDVSVEGDPVAAEGRRRAVIDSTSTWAGSGSSRPDERNVELWIRKP